MTLAEWRKKQGISHYTFGTMLGIRSINPATNSQRYCLESKEKRFPKPKMVKIFTSYSFDNDKLTIGNVTVFPRCIVKKIIIEK